MYQFSRRTTPIRGRSPDSSTSSSSLSVIAIAAFWCARRQAPPSTVEADTALEKGEFPWQIGRCHWRDTGSVRAGSLEAGPEIYARESSVASPGVNEAEEYHVTQLHAPVPRSNRPVANSRPVHLQGRSSGD
jgi:hypothetical protein